MPGEDRGSASAGAALIAFINMVAQFGGLVGPWSIIEINVPDEWSTGQTLAVRQLLQRAVSNAQPVICPVRKDITPEQLDDIYSRVSALIRDSGLAVPARAV